MFARQELVRAGSVSGVVYRAASAAMYVASGGLRKSARPWRDMVALHQAVGTLTMSRSPMTAS